MRRDLSPISLPAIPGRAVLLLGALLLAIPFTAVPLRPAHAQMDSREAIRLHNEVLELRQEVQGLRNQGGSSLGSYRQPPPSAGAVEAPSGNVVAGLVDRIARLEDQVRTLQGRIDEADNARKVLHDDLQKEIDDINYKLGGSLAPGGAAGGDRTSLPPGNLGGGAPQTPAGPPAARPPRTPELAMQEGNAALARRDYATAQAAAKEVLAMPRSPRANDAQFLLARALAGKHDYAGAAVAYDDAYNRSKKGAHAQDALLGLAHSLAAIKEDRAACVTLDKLRREFPAPRRDLTKQIAGARQQANCR